MSENLLTFLDIEGSLATAVINPWKKQAKLIAKELKVAVDNRDELKIANALDKLYFDDYVDRVQGRVSALMVSAMLYGASFAGGKKGKTIFHDPQADLLKKVDSALVVYNKIFTQSATQYIKRQASTKAHELLYAKDTENMQKAADEDVVAALNKAVLENGQMMSDIGANLATSRLVSFGFLAEAKSRGIQRYQLQAVLDSRTSQICRRLHGREFHVDLAYEHVDRLLGIEDPEQLKAMAPFVKGTKESLHQLENLSDSELEARGISVPPFHPSCRTLLVKVGKAGKIPDYTPTVTPADENLLSIFPIIDTATDKPKVTVITPTTTLIGLTSFDLDLILDAVNDAVKAGMTIEEASKRHDPNNHLGLR